MNLLDYLAAPVTPPAQAHSPTSTHAAKEIAGVTGMLRMRVFNYIRECGQAGSTDEQGMLALDMAPNTYRPRRIECVAAGVVKDSGRNRPTRSGRRAVVWVAVVQEKSV